MSSIRAKAVCLFRRDSQILLSEGYDPAKDEKYLIPVGGGIEFGEKAEEAAIRETLEEIGVQPVAEKTHVVLQLRPFEPRQRFWSRNLLGDRLPLELELLFERIGQSRA